VYFIINVGNTTSKQQLVSLKSYGAGHIVGLNPKVVDQSPTSCPLTATRKNGLHFSTTWRRQNSFQRKRGGGLAWNYFIRSAAVKRCFLSPSRY